MRLWPFFRPPEPPEPPDFPAAANVAPAMERRRRIDDAWRRLADHERRIRALEAQATQDIDQVRRERQGKR